MQEGLIVIVSGFSGAGKGTVIKEMMRQYPQQYALSVSMTTRSPRNNEVPDVDYHFVSQGTFDALVAEDGFLEHAGYVGNNYGTPKKFVLENIAAGRDTILEIEVQGAKIIKEKYPNALTVFVTPPSVDELRSRLTARGTETAEKIESRLRRAAEESREMDWYEELLVNDQFDVAVQSLHELIQSHKQPKPPVCTSEQRQKRSQLTQRIQEEFVP